MNSMINAWVVFSPINLSSCPSCRSFWFLLFYSFKFQWCCFLRTRSWVSRQHQGSLLHPIIQTRHWSCLWEWRRIRHWQGQDLEKNWQGSGTCHCRRDHSEPSCSRRGEIGWKGDQRASDGSFYNQTYWCWRHPQQCKGVWRSHFSCWRSLPRGTFC